MYLLGEKIELADSLRVPNKAFLNASVYSWLKSDERKKMLTAKRYFKNKNDVLEDRRWYIDRLGVRRVDENLSNVRLAHPYLRKLTRQKINYLLSKKPSIQATKKEFADALTAVMTLQFLELLKNVAKDAILCGKAWVQVFYNEQGLLSFKRIPPEEVLPFWYDSDHTRLAALCRIRNVKYLQSSGTTTTRQVVEYYTEDGVYEWELDHSLGDAVGKPKPLFKLEGPNEVQGMVWEKLPFVCFKYNPEEMGLLEWIKDMVDDYDRHTSGLSNVIHDIPDSIKIIRNYSGSDKAEWSENLKTYRMAFVGPDGGVEVLRAPIDTQAVETHLNRLRKDIFECANGVDTQEAAIGTASGIALKFRYSDLDIDVDDLQGGISVALEELFWFLKVDLLNREGKNYMDETFDIIFNTDMMLNESDAIADVKNSLGVLSNRTILANHPWVTDVEEELTNAARDRDEMLAQADAALGIGGAHEPKTAGTE